MEINLADREVVGSPPVTIDIKELFRFDGNRLAVRVSALRVESFQNVFSSDRHNPPRIVFDRHKFAPACRPELVLPFPMITLPSSGLVS